MANPEHHKILKQGVKAWNSWHLEHFFDGGDLSNVNLSGMGLNGIDFVGTDLSHSNLSKANLSGANLGATLRWTQ